MQNFYWKPKKDLIEIGKNVITFAKENNINLMKIYGTKKPLPLGKKLMENQAKYMTEGKSKILIALRKRNAIKKAKELVGSTNPAVAKKRNNKKPFNRFIALCNS